MVVPEGRLHLADGGDDILGLSDQLLLLCRDLAHMIVQGLGQSREELHVWINGWLAWLTTSSCGLQYAVRMIRRMGVQW